MSNTCGRTDFSVGSYTS